MPTLAADIEGNALLYSISQIWCIVVKDIESRQYHFWCYDKKIGDQYVLENGKNYTHVYDLEKLLSYMSTSKLIFHNGIMFDIPAIQKFFPTWEPKKVEDTFILSSLFEPDRLGGHSLAQWGKETGEFKIDHEDWSVFSREMLNRCVRDADLTESRWESLQAERNSWDWEKAIRLEYTVAKLCAQMEMNGILLDQDKAKEVLERINKELEEIDKKLLEMIPLRVTDKSESGAKMPPVTKIWKKDGSYSKQVEDWIKE